MRLADLLPYALPWRHKHLIWQFARREVLGRYRSSWLGPIWAVLSPLMLLMVYTFVFVGVLRVRWPGAESGGGLEFALQLMAGMTVLNFFSEIVNRSPLLILEQPNLVKKVIFPLEVLPWVALLSAAFHALLYAVILVLGAWWTRGGLPLTAVAAPLVLVAMTPLLLGLGWFLAALGTYIRDAGQITVMVTSLMLFLSPVFYSLQSVPEILRGWIWFNPLTLVIESLRQVILQGVWPDWSALLLYVLICSVIGVLGAAFFHATRKGFADVL